jgi:uncharacterized membrane protein YdjX (TVP38/TMEM64 family)
MLILFIAVYILTTVPVFAPPTWMALSYAGFQYPSYSVTFLALVGAAAATLGRLTLAKLARVIVRQKILSEPVRENVDVLSERLAKTQKATISVYLFYAFSPLPSNFLFIAYGLTSLNLSRIAIPFFLGRFLGYSFFVFVGSIAARKVTLESTEWQPYLGVSFVLTQILLSLLVYLFTKVDWRALFVDRKFRWMNTKRAIKLSPIKADLPR